LKDFKFKIRWETRGQFSIKNQISKQQKLNKIHVFNGHPYHIS
jgi:hypothetical protein